MSGVANAEVCDNCTAAAETASTIFSDIIAVAISDASINLEGASVGGGADVSQSVSIFIETVANATAEAVAEVCVWMHLKTVPPATRTMMVHRMQYVHPRCCGLGPWHRATGACHLLSLDRLI